MITLSDAILAINPDAEFDYDDIDNIFWRKKTKPISKDLILQKYRELKDIELEKQAYEKANELTFLGKIINSVYENRILLFKYRQALATSSGCFAPLRLGPQTYGTRAAGLCKPALSAGRAGNPVATDKPG